jgi:hypothetical protein
MQIVTMIFVLIKGALALGILAIVPVPLAVVGAALGAGRQRAGRAASAGHGEPATTTEGVLMGETTEKISAEEASAEQDSKAKEAKEWIEQAQDEADRQAHEVEELPEQPY